jgi:hypothetical protein
MLRAQVGSGPRWETIQSIFRRCNFLPITISALCDTIASLHCPAVPMQRVYSTAHTQSTQRKEIGYDQHTVNF